MCKNYFIAVFRQFKEDTSGMVSPFSALSLMAIIGVLAVTLEAGYWANAKNDLQISADMAAYAGAMELVEHSKSQAITAATLDAIKNGYDSENGSIEVNSPAVSGAFTSKKSVEVMITQKGNQYFSSIFGSDKIKYNVRAVASLVPGGPLCMLSLHPTSSGALTASGSSSINLNECGIGVNSSSASAVSLGGATSVAAECFSIVGGISGENHATLSCDAAETGLAEIIDPYGSIAPPNLADYPSCKAPYKQPGNKRHRYLDPGRYCGANLSFKDQTFLTGGGVYIFDGISVNFNSAHSALNGTGVTIFLMNGARLSGLTGGTTINLTPPTTGPYGGITIFSDPATQTEGENVSFRGNSSSNIEGLIYYPNQDLTYNGTTTAASKCLLVVARQITFIGNSSLEITGCGPSYNLPPLKSQPSITLVE